MSEHIFVAAGATPIEAEPRGARPRWLFGGPSGGGGGTGADPHFVGFDGQRYDVMGEPGRFYNIISAPTFQATAHFGAFGAFTLIDQVGLKFPGHGVYFDLSLAAGRPAVWLDHRLVMWTADVDTGLRDGRGRPVKGGVSVLERRTVVHAGRYILEVVWCDDHGEPHPKFGKLDVPHLDLYFYPSHQELPPDPAPPHGLLGVTARGPYTPAPGGEQGEGVLDVLEPGSTYRDYEVPGLWSDDFKFNQYKG